MLNVYIEWTHNLSDIELGLYSSCYFLLCSSGIFLEAWLEHDSWCWFDCLKCAAIKDMKTAILAWDIPGELCWQPIEQTNGL